MTGAAEPEYRDTPLPGDAGQGAVSAALHGLNGLTPLPVAAREFALAGVPVFPCVPGGKRPLTLHGFHDASTDLRQIEAWWRRAPAANIGLPTGHASGVVVVDVDVSDRVDGHQGFARAARAGLVEGWELLIRSPSGGMHAYFPATPGALQRSWQAGSAGIDFRADGGYIIAPPSARMIDGERVLYRVEQIASGPVHAVSGQQLRDFLDPRPAFQQGERVGEMGTLDAARLAAWVAHRPEGERNLGLFKAACRLAEQGTAPRDALDALGAAAHHAGLGVREITRTIGSAYRHVSNYGPRARAPLPSADDDLTHRASRAASQTAKGL